MTVTKKAVGTSVAREDGPDKVTGRGKYSLDIVLPDTLWCKILRSPYAHAKIKNIDASRALAMPGVVAVLTGEEVKGLRFGKRLIDEPILAWDKVLYIGDKIAAIAAETEDIAESALSLIDVEYEELPAAVTLDEAKTEQAPILHPDFNSYDGVPKALDEPSNIFAETEWANGDVEKAFEESDKIVERFYTTPRTHQAYLEPHNTIVWIDEEEQVQVWNGSKSPFANKNSLAGVIGVPAEKITINFAYIGGDFGGKGDINGVPVCYFLAKKTGRPIKLNFDYSEELQAMNPRHESTMRVKAGVMSDGTLTAWEAEVYFNSGAYGGYKPVPGSNLPGIAEIAGPYKIPNVKINAYQVYTNTVPCGFHRSPGEVQGIFAGESHMDIVAEEIGMDPIAFRLQNVVHDGDETPVGHGYLDIKAEEVIREAVKASGWDKPKAPGVGRGIALGHRSQVGGETHVAININADGSVTAFNSIFDSGMGNHTMLQQVIADELEITVDRIKVVPYNTDDVPFDTGVGGSRGSYVISEASLLASNDLKLNLKKLASEYKGWDEDIVEFSEGSLVNQRTQEVISMEEIAERSGGVVEGKGDLQDMTPNKYTSFVAQVAEVQVDIETGNVDIKLITAVHDTSKIINPVGFNSQLEGGMVGAFGYAVMEDLTVDESGRVANPSFADFKIPTERDIPPLKVALVKTSEGRGQYKVKGIGEHSNLATAPAIANAIKDAIDVRLFSLPFTSEKLLNQINK